MNYQTGITAVIKIKGKLLRLFHFFVRTFDFLRQTGQNQIGPMAVFSISNIKVLQGDKKRIHVNKDID